MTTPPPEAPAGGALFPPPAPGTAQPHLVPGATEPLPPFPPSGAPQAPAQGTNGFAIAALVCGLLFFVPLSAILAIVFGIVALAQLRRTHQRGRGMAITGIVIGSLAMVAAISAITWFVLAAPERGADGTHVSSGTTLIDSLRAGDCFSGVEGDRLRSVTAHPCAEPHEAQLAALVTLDEAPFPGVEEASVQAEDACLDKADALVRADVTEELDLLYLVPDSSLAWDANRTAHCIFVAVDGEMTGSVLR